MQPFDFETARRRMVDEQIRPWDVDDERLLGVIRRTPREDFVAPQYRSSLGLLIGAAAFLLLLSNTGCLFCPHNQR